MGYKRARQAAERSILFLRRIVGQAETAGKIAFTSHSQVNER
jgi:hypothetical protein